MSKETVDLLDPKVAVLPPMYVCHKEVRAARIVHILESLASGEGLLAFNDNVSSIVVSAEYMEKHKPKIGGMYVLYEDGYQSYSPGKSFDGGYRLKASKKQEESRRGIFMTAITAYEINRAYCQALGDNSQWPWHKAAPWQTSSVLAGVQFHVENPDAPASASHESWMRRKEAEGWVYGDGKDPEKKIHPCMVPFTELPHAQRAKDHLFKQVVHSLLITPRSDGGTVL